jgi:hypothetical protein
MAIAKARRDTDFDSWLAQQVDFLRVGRFYDLDPVHLANALEGLGATRRDAVQGDLVRILEFLICMEFSPAEQPLADWKLEAAARRASLNAKIDTSPTLRKVVADTLGPAWERARAYAAITLARDGVAKGDIPATCPYQLERVLDDDWWPENRHGLGRPQAS